MKKYDIIIVGAGLTGAMIAYKNKGKKILVLEKSPEVGGLCATAEMNGITVHLHGTHVFHTDNEDVWRFVNGITPFRPYVLNVKANYKGRVYDLPFNMHTFNQLWGCEDAETARKLVETRWSDVFETLIKGYSEKQWGRRCEDIPQEVFKRIPVRFEWNNNYHDDRYSGIPENGYTGFIKKLFAGAEIRFGVDFLKNKGYYEGICDKVYYTGRIDEYYDFMYGALEWRWITHESETLDTDDFQGVPQMNYTDAETPWTRIIEHRHFDPAANPPSTIITKEYPFQKSKRSQVAYPINDGRNNALYEKYKSIENGKVVFAGRLGEYKYYDMDDIVEKYM